MACMTSTLLVGADSVSTRPSSRTLSGEPTLSEHVAQTKGHPDNPSGRLGTYLTRILAPTLNTGSVFDPSFSNLCLRAIFGSTLDLYTLFFRIFRHVSSCGIVYRRVFPLFISGLKRNNKMKKTKVMQPHLSDDQQEGRSMIIYVAHEQSVKINLHRYVVHQTKCFYLIPTMEIAYIHINHSQLPVTFFMSNL